MSKSLTIVCPVFPPERGGLADHTEKLSSILSSHFEVTVLTSASWAGKSDSVVQPKIQRWGSVTQLTEALHRTKGPILWQYVPHLYGRGGVNLALPVVMQTMRSRGQIVLAHEIAAPYSLWPHRFWYAFAQRLQWKRLIGAVDVVGISTERWLFGWNQKEKGLAEKSFLAPSPSNIFPTTLRDAGCAWRQRNGVAADVPVVGFFGTISAPKRFDWVVEAWRSIRVKFPNAIAAIVGDQPSGHFSAVEKAHVRMLGHQNEAQVSAMLYAVDLLLLPFIDGVSERRGSFMAGLAHGCPVLTTTGESTGPTLRNSDAFSVANQKGEFAEKARRLISNSVERRETALKGQKLYEERYDWPVLKSNLETQLKKICQLQSSPFEHLYLKRLK
ncbi:MAG: glycosyltransferase family 4 protein [Verrucomicrobiota bacterium]|nr:glycosyltransferase family 4 protein [Verrucomicrobiota bacterium]